MTVVSDTEAAKYYNKQPKKRVGAGVLFFNQQGEVLIVKPNYLEKWLWVGGSANDGEAPMTTALRECQEEIGVVPSGLWLAFVNYLPPQPTGQSDILQFLFASKVDDDFINQIKLEKTEIDEARFVAVHELVNYMHKYRARAVQTYINVSKNEETVYLEDGRTIDS